MAIILGLLRLATAGSKHGSDLWNCRDSLVHEFLPFSRQWSLMSFDDGEM